MRTQNTLIEDGLIADGSAPSYYIEGLLYNVPNDQFLGDYQDTFLNNGHTCWEIADGNNFIDASIKLWNEW
jgi:hypothetical protein